MKTRKFIPEFDDIPKPRAKMPELEVDERRLCFAEVELGFPEELALAEAARCFSCRLLQRLGLCFDTMKATTSADPAGLSTSASAAPRP